MSDTPISDPGPEFDLDIALSADLDGELADYAAELGRSVDELRAELDTPARVARRRELAAARDAVAVPPAALDELTRRRLLAGAGAADRAVPPRRDRAPWIRGAAAAAITLVVLGGVLALTRTGNDGTTASSASRDAVGTVPSGDLGDLGALDQAGIDELINGNDPGGDGTARQRSPASEPTAAANGSAESANSLDSGSAVPGFAEDADARLGREVDDCAAAFTSDRSVIRFRAAGTYEGQQAVVLGVARDGRTIVFVVAADDCTRVLYSASR